MTGAVTKSITDVDTTQTSDFSNLPSGWSTPTGGGLHLKTQYEVDALGRTTKVTNPVGHITYIVYNDTNYEVRTYAGWDSTSGLPTGPTYVTREDRADSYTETLTMTATPHLTNGRPDGTESISGIQTLSRTYTSAGGQVDHVDAYFSISGLTYSTSTSLGTENTNFYRTRYGYDQQGRQNRVQSPTGTIYRSVYDSEGRVVSTWVGTNDTPTSGGWSPTNNGSPCNMVKVSENVYDDDGNLTQTTAFPGGGAADRVRQFYYDWRDRLVATKAGVQTSEGSTTHRPITYITFDNLGAATQQQVYDGDGVTITSSGGVPQAPSSSLLRAQTDTSYDEQGRVYQTQTYSVNPSSGAVSTYALTSNTWYDHRGQVIKTAAPGGMVNKLAYDGAGRVTKSYVTDGGGDSTWSDADDVTGDAVLTQSETQYDAAGNVLVTITKDRFHDETATGELGNATTAPKARVSYAGYYYDLADRLTDTVIVGTNGGSAWTRPNTVPSRSDTMLVSSTAFTAAGFVDSTTDPRGFVTKQFYDNLGRVTKTVAAYDGGSITNTTNKTTEYTYDGAGHMLTLQADLTGGAYQKTQWTYGVSTGTGDGINSNDILKSMQYPDPSTGNPSTSSQEVYTVNAHGEQLTKSDRNGNVHTYSFDVLGRQTSDAVTTLGTGVDGSVRRIETAYDTQGNAYLHTSFDAATAGNVVNQVQEAFNGLGQLITEYQAVSGAVNTGTTPKVQYTFTEMSGGANHSRLTAVIYPNGRTIGYNYASGLNDTISRLTSLSDSGTTLESYSYLGLGTIVIRSHPQPGVDLTYVKQTGESNGDAGDQYIGLDRFGRVVDQRWIVASSGTATDRFQYGYDRDGNRLYRDNLVNSAFGELYHANGSSNGYDNLNQLQAFARGTLNSGKDTISSPAHSQSWGFDAAGNWATVTTDGTTQTRGANAQNEITSIGGLTTPAYDANGNMTTDQAGKTLIYDAWNSLVQYKNGSTVLLTYSFDALGRRVTENPGTLRAFYYSSGWQSLEERVGGAVADQYVWSQVYVDAMVERDRDTNADGTVDDRLYAQQDANWNVTAVVSTSGTVLERAAYDPYGSVTFLSPSFGTQSASNLAWVYLHQGGRFEAVSGLYHFRGREHSAALGQWIGLDPKGLLVDVNGYRYELNSPQVNVDPFGLDVTVFWVEGATGPAQKKGGLEIHIIDPLKNTFKTEPKVKWQGFQAGMGIGLGQKARDVANAIKKCKDKTVLIGYSWGGYAAVQAMSMAYYPEPGAPAVAKPTFRVNLVYTIDPIIGTPGPGYDYKPYHNGTSAEKVNTVLGDFDEWHNWYQQVDDGGSIPFLKVRGRKLDDPRITNKEYVATDFKNPKGAHSEIVTKKEIRDEIEKGIKKLL